MINNNNENDNKIYQLEKILLLNQEKIKNVDTKNGLLLSSNAFLITAVSFLYNNFEKWSIVLIITFLSLSALFFILSISPFFWNNEERKKKNPLHSATIFKNRNKNLDFLTNKITEEDYKIQIKRNVEVLMIKYAFQWIGILILISSFILFIVSLVV